MVRSIAIIVWAIGLSQPTMASTTRKAYAEIIQEECKKRHIDPFTIVALVHNESRWRQSVISSNKEDYGLGQIRARYMGGCRGTVDPINAPTAACKATQASLLNGMYNLRMVARHITNWRKTCRRMTKRPALFKRWLHGYGGMGSLKRGIICGQKRTKRGWRDLPVRPLLRRIMDHRLRLIRLSKRRRRQ